MTITITHTKHNNVTDWTQPQLNTIIAGGAAPLPPAGTVLNDVTLSSDWNANHTITGNFDSDYLKLDQTTPQTVIGGAPNFSGGVNIGGTSLSFAGLTPPLQIQGTTHSNGSFVQATFATATLPEFVFYRSKNATVGAATAVASGDDLGRFNWYGASQTGTFSSQVQAASIKALVDGAVTSTSVPGRIEFGTTAVGGLFATTRMTITSSGLVNIAGLTANQFVQTDGSKNLLSVNLFGNGNTWSSTQTFTSGIISNGSSTFNASTSFTDGVYSVNIIPGGNALDATDGTFEAKLCDGTSAGFFQDAAHLNLRLMDGTNCLTTVDSLGNFINLGDGAEAAYFANDTIKLVAKLITTASAAEFSDSIGESVIICGATGAAAITGRFMVYDSVGPVVNIDGAQRHLCNAASGATLIDYSGTGAIMMSSSGVLQALFGDANNTNYALSTDSSKNIYIENLISRYNGVNTVATGIASIVAQANLTTQAAAIAATTVYAVPSTGAGQYRLSWIAKVTRAASTSSVLGGTNGFQVKYTDQDDSVVVTTGALANENTLALSTNTTQTIYAGSIMVNCKASTNLQYIFDYTSVGVTTMQYNLHIRVERI